MQRDIKLIRLLIVACGMLSHSSSMAVRSCWIFWWELEHARRSRASQTCSIGYMSDECAGQQLCTDPCDMGPCIIMHGPMLNRAVMVADEWHDNGPHDLITVSLCIQIAIE